MAENPADDASTRKVTLATDVPEEVKEILEQQDCYQWEAVTEAVFNTFGGERLTSPAALEREIDLEERKERNALEEMRDAKDRAERHAQRAESLRARRDEILGAQESKQEALDALLEDMVNEGMVVWDDHPRVKGLASRWFGGEQNAPTAFEELLERNDERENSLPESQFEKGGSPVNHDFSFKSTGDNDE